MFSIDKIREIVELQIKKDEKLGNQAGGSGHLSHVDFEINSIDDPVKTGENWKIKYAYTTIITTEFTYYPDNPPYEYKHSREIIINSNYQIIEEEK